MAKKEDLNYIVRNRKARHEYQITQTFEAGIVLQGTEVKSIREGKINLSDSYAAIEEGEVWLKNVHISEYKNGSINNHEPTRPRKLLLNRREIKKLAQKVKEKGFTLIPLGFYLSNGKVKVELALVTGKRKYDKREAIAKRDLEREMNRKGNFHKFNG